MSQDPQPNYSINEICWNLTAHYPWWPGIVEQVRRHKEIIIYRVKLIGTAIEYRVYQVQQRMKRYSSMREHFLTKDQKIHKLFPEALQQAEQLYAKHGAIVDKLEKQPNHNFNSLLKNQTSNTREDSSIFNTREKRKRGNGKDFFAYESEQEDSQNSCNAKRKRPFADSKPKHTKDISKSNTRKIRKVSAKSVRQYQNFFTVKNSDFEENLEQCVLGKQELKVSGRKDNVKDEVQPQKFRNLPESFSKDQKNDSSKKSYGWKQKAEFIKNFTRSLRDKDLDMESRQQIGNKIFEKMDQSQLDKNQFANQALKWIEKTTPELILLTYKNWEPQSVFQEEQQKQEPLENQREEHIFSNEQKVSEEKNLKVVAIEILPPREEPTVSGQKKPEIGDKYQQSNEQKVQEIQKKIEEIENLQGYCPYMKDDKTIAQGKEVEGDLLLNNQNNFKSKQETYILQQKAGRPCKLQIFKIETTEQEGKLNVEKKPFALSRCFEVEVKCGDSIPIQNEKNQ